MKKLIYVFIAVSLANCETRKSDQISQSERDQIKHDIEIIVDRIVESYNNHKVDDAFGDYKEFRYGIPGKFLTYDQFIEIYKKYFDDVVSQTYKKISGDLSYVDSNFAICTFITSFKAEKRNGEKVNQEGYGTTLIFKRVSGKWIIIGGHES